MKRRQFLQSSAAATLFTASSNSLLALDKNNKYRKQIGIQLYTLRNQITEDTAKTIKAVKEAGYAQGEMYGFPNCDPMIAAAKEVGLELHSTHFDWDTLINPKDKDLTDYKKIIEKAKKVGLSHLVIPYLHNKDRKTLDDYKRTAEKCNKGAELAKKAGLKLAYHNHAFEFEPQDKGKSGYDIFIEEFSKDMLFEIDVFWVKVANMDPIVLMNKLKGRVSQLHLKDLQLGTKVPNYASIPKEAFKELGNGMIEMEPIIEAAAGVGVEHCHVEQDHSPAPLKSIVQSMKYLKGL